MNLAINTRTIKWIIRGLLLLIALMIVFIALKVTGILHVYAVPDDSMRPTFEERHRVWGFKATRPFRDDFVAYYHSSDSSIRISRVAAMGGDTLTIQDGILSVNGFTRTSEQDVWRTYLLRKKISETEDKNNTSGKYKDRIVRTVMNDEFSITLLNLSIQEADEMGKSEIIQLYPGTYKNMWQPENRTWNLVEFGPVIIPPNTYFLLSDNRGDTGDSRFSGPLDAERIIGVVY